MFERWRDRDDEGVDERAFHGFSQSYRGEQGYSYRWESTARGLVPTSTVYVEGSSQHICTYCGHIALPIQKSIHNPRTRSTEYPHVGYTCVCKSAMDEVDSREVEKTIRKQFEMALRRLEASKPKHSKEVLLAIIDLQAAEKKKDIRFHADGGGVSPYVFERAGLRLTSSEIETNKDYEGYVDEYED